MGKDLGYNLKMLDLGGGYAGKAAKSRDEIARIVNESLEEHFDDLSIKVISEPGMYYSNAAFKLVANIHSKRLSTEIDKETGKEVKIRMYYVDVGIFGALISVLYQDYYEIKPVKGPTNGQRYPSIVWGPTCDSSDQLSDHVIQLPEMQIGDWLIVEETGGYTLSIASEFNGFPTPTIHGVINEQAWSVLTKNVHKPMSEDRFIRGEDLNNYLTDDFIEWRLLGQEQNGSFLFSWIQSNADLASPPRTRIGEYDYQKGTLVPIYTFDKKVDCIQASVNNARTLLAYVLKESRDEGVYKVYLYQIDEPFERAMEIGRESSRQIMVQFLYPKVSVLSGNVPIKFLVLVHQEGIHQYIIKSKTSDLNEDTISSELLVKNFVWAQWDPLQQTLYYIHNRKRNRGLVEGEIVEDTDPSKITPTLSGLQFNDELPHETVLNIPLNLPHLTTNSCLIYEDNTVPLRVHDCSLDLIVVTDSAGFVCICHHYLYQPVQPVIELSEEDSSPVHFAYTVTVLHQSCVIKCVIPDIPWNRAKRIRPLFRKTGDYLMVLIPEICTHLLDIGLSHEPFCHITTKPLLTAMEAHHLCLASIIEIDEDKEFVINLATLDLIELDLPSKILMDAFKSDTILENKLAILHYFLVHSEEPHIAAELITWHSSTPFTLAFPEILKEYLIASSYTSVQGNLPLDAVKLATFLPVSTQRLGLETEVKLDGYTIAEDSALSQRHLDEAVGATGEAVQRSAEVQAQSGCGQASDFSGVLSENKKWEEGCVADKYNDRSYIVEEIDGEEFRRNRKLINKTKIPFIVNNREPLDSIAYEDITNYSIDSQECIFQIESNQSNIESEIEILSEDSKLSISYHMNVNFYISDPEIEILSGDSKLKNISNHMNPEALSRCSTPLSPSGGASSTFADFLSNQTGAKNQADSLPFLEIDSCTASRQEHIISVNLREISMHLLKQSSNNTNKFQQQNQSSMHVHAVATRYVTAQLDQSRQLCQILCKAALYDPEEDFDKGFVYINKIDEDRRYVMFKLLEKYYMAVQAIAFPLPQGFTSFFAYLGYKTMEFRMFLQYVDRHVFELQVDIMKIIMAEPENTKADVHKKLRLLSVLPRSRAKRLLNQWNHPVSTMIRAREHAQNILSGISAPTSTRRQYGIPKNTDVKGLGGLSSSNMTPMDTFLELLTAKASLTEIDFGLLIEATESWNENIF
ncbi:unnamed protein product [Phaedon cochleariae]|uniref:Protein pigeon n=1 Tax=Phaedon cochleariae TaxID=80249 RepID=A0A9P0DDP5_PHACE|nr:unnamed protein product [Phaedon cochleariae]